MNFLINIDKVFHELLLQEDTDKDKKITKDDNGPKKFALVDENTKQEIVIEGTYHLSNLLQELALLKENKVGFALTLLTAHYFANISQYVIFVFICFMCLLGYILAGFFGIACCAMGFLSGPFSLVTVNCFACFSAEAVKMSSLGCIFNDAKETLYKHAWAARNFSIFS